MEIVYTPTFLRTLKTFSTELQNEVIEKIELFRQLNQHKSLKVHKLKGRLKGRYSFSVNYHIRVVFIYSRIHGKRIANLLAIGDHDVYRY